MKSKEKDEYSDGTAEYDAEVFDNFVQREHIVPHEIFDDLKFVGLEIAESHELVKVEE